MKSVNYWNSKRLARKRWSLNATAKRERLRLERAENPPVEFAQNVFKPRLPKADLRVNIDCTGYGRIQFSAHKLDGKILVGSAQLSPREFGRRLGDMFHLWLNHQ